VFKVVD
jgi:hypothetical protein